MKSFFSNFRKQPPSPSLEDTTPTIINRYADATQARAFSNKSSSSLQSSRSFWNDPTRVNMVNNEEITLENERILPSFSSTFLNSYSNQNTAIFSSSPLSNGGEVSRFNDYQNNSVTEDIKNSQSLIKLQTNNSNQNGKSQKDKQKSNKNKKNDEDEDDSGGIVLVKTRMITDDVPARDYGGLQVTKPNSSSQAKNLNIHEKQNTLQATNQAVTNVVNSTEFTGLLPISRKIETRPDSWFEDKDANSTNILDKTIKEAQEYVVGISKEAKNLKTQAPLPPVKTDLDFSRSDSDLKVDISMFERGKLPKIKKKKSDSEISKNEQNISDSKLPNNNEIYLPPNQTIQQPDTNDISRKSSNHQENTNNQVNLNNDNNTNIEYHPTVEKNNKNQSNKTKNTNIANNTNNKQNTNSNINNKQNKNNKQNINSNKKHEPGTNNSSLNMYNYIATSNSSNENTQKSRDISQQFKVGLPTFVQNVFPVNANDEQNKSRANDIKKSLSDKSNRQDLKVNPVNGRKSKHDLSRKSSKLSSNLFNNQSEVTSFNEASQAYTYENSDIKKIYISERTENVGRNVSIRNQSQIELNKNLQYENSSQITENKNVNKYPQVDFNLGTRYDSPQTTSTTKAIAPLPPVFTIRHQEDVKLDKKPMIEIPTNHFVKNNLFKSKLEKIIANPVSPGKRSKSMPSLTEEHNVGEKKKYKFLVEGIDIPARTIEDVVDEGGEGGNRKIQKGFAYIKGKQLADEVTKRANEVASRKPHEYVEHNAMEREILSHNQPQDDALIKARHDLHAHLKGLHRKNSLPEEAPQNNQYVSIDDHNFENLNYKIDENPNIDKNDLENVNNKLIENPSQPYNRGSLSGKSKSEFDLSRKDLDEGWGSYLGQNHSIPHDTSRVFLKPHDQDLETLKKLKKERYRYLKKDESRKDQIDKTHNKLSNLSDSSNTDSQLFKNSQININSLQNKKNKIKSRSKHKQRNAVDTQVNAQSYAADEKTGDDKMAYNRKQASHNQQLSHQYRQNNKNGHYRGKTRVVKDGGTFVDYNVDKISSGGYQKAGEFEDLGRIHFKSTKREIKSSKNNLKYDDNPNFNRKKQVLDGKISDESNAVDRVIAGFITLPDSNLSKSLDDIYSEISGKLTITKNKAPRTNTRKSTTPTNAGVKISGPSVYYNPFYSQDHRFGSLPNVNRFENLKTNQPTNLINVQNQSHNHKEVMYNDNNAFQNNVIWEQPSADPEIERVTKMGKLYRVQVKLNNTPMTSRVGSSMSNRNHFLSNHSADHQSKFGFKSSNYVKNELPTPKFVPNELSSQFISNRSNVTNYTKALNTAPLRDVFTSDRKITQTEDDRFAIKSIKSTEPIPRSQTPNKIEFDLELLQSTQPVNNNSNNVTRQNHEMTSTDHNQFSPPQEFADKPLRRSRPINPQRSDQNLLLVNNQYRNEDPYLSDIQNLVKGSVLIQNPLNQKQGVKQQDDNNLFGGQYYQARENPIYASDMETVEGRNTRKILASPNAPSIAVDWEETGGYQRKLPINKQWYHDYVFGKKHDFSPKPSGPWKLRSSQNKERNNVSSTNAEEWTESGHIRQTVDVEKEEEELIGPLGGDSIKQVETALNIDAISEKVELSLLNGVVTIEVKVRCERLVPIRGTEDMFKKSAVVVTRMIDIDMSVSAERQATYKAAVNLSTKEGSDISGGLRLGTKDTFELYCKLMQMADAANGTEEGLLFGSVHIDKELEEERRLPNESMSPENIFNDSNLTTPTSFYQKSRSRFL